MFIYTFAGKRWQKDGFYHFYSDDINTCMTNREFLQSLYDTVKSFGMVGSQYEFGDLCGREQSWFSCAKSVNRAMPMETLVTLAFKLERFPPELLPKGTKPLVKKFTASLWEMIEAQATRPKFLSAVFALNLGRDIIHDFS